MPVFAAAGYTDEETYYYYDYSECEPTTVEIDGTTNIAALAQEYNTTAAQVCVAALITAAYGHPPSGHCNPCSVCGA
jgi:hypothetical protein